jgi:transcription-repair coupling factor (superfamily II helicase)
LIDLKKQVIDLIDGHLSNLKSGGTMVTDELLGTIFSTLYFDEREPTNLILLAPNNYEANRLYNYLSIIKGEKNIYFFPSDELIRVEYLSSSKEMVAQQIYTLFALTKNKDAKTIIMSPSSLYRFLPSKETFLNNIISLKVHDTIDFEGFKAMLSSLGYLRTSKVDQSLQFAVRGDIVDVFTLNYDNPIRIEFFGDEIESMRFFDIGTQNSFDLVEEVDILPATLNLLTKNEVDAAKDRIERRMAYDLQFLGDFEKGVLEATVKEDISDISKGYLSTKNYKYYGFLQDIHYGVGDYLDKYTVILEGYDEFNKDKKQLFDDGISFLLDLQKSGKSISHLSFYNEGYQAGKNASFVLGINSFYLGKDDISISLRKPSFGTSKDKNTLLVLKGYLALGYKILCLVPSKQDIEILKECLKTLDVEYAMTSGFEFDEKYSVNIALNDFPQGFELPDKKIVVLTNQELFGYKPKNVKYSGKFKEGIILGSYLELEKGDYVVHEYNGIGQYLGIETLLVDGKHEDYLKIAYAGGDKVYVPLYQFNLIRKYVGKEGSAPSLSKLGSDKWEKTKKKIKERVNNLADRLLKIYQERARIEGFSFQKDDEIMESFENSFPYELTGDQKRSLEEIKRDMESPHPMDRLLCGDVGFGKTEIAFRAAMKAILSGKQVCLLCPTTLLARQHFEVAKERFENYGVHIAMLSRLVSSGENRKTIEELGQGKIDLLIGTHMALSNRIKFKDLGLLIIDEEQRFGVEQKEKIKEKKLNVDCLTLSATPIPRTLQSSLIGLKSVSTIETPPRERMPIQTYVIPYDESVICDLIKRELVRNGQVFYVYNYIDSIYQKEFRLQQLVPEAKIGVIHGRMEKSDVDEVMSQFYSGDLNVLLATSIIENGIDIRNANLMLIEDADHFGLAQLYQIKGRVGRGDRMAFAYLMIDKGKKLTDQSKKRLKTIQDFTELGSGYKIAQRDLLIRGAGDILGPEQAGFIDEVGVDMYIKLLNQAIEEKKTGVVKKADQSVPINLNIDAYIPKEYAGDDDKIELYQKILACKDKKDVEKLRNSVRDIYGKIPVSMELIFKKKIIDIELQDKDCFEKTQEYDERLILVLGQRFSSVDGIGSELFSALLRYINKLKISYRNKKIEIEIPKKDDWIDFLISVMEIISSLYHRVAR